MRSDRGRLYIFISTYIQWGSELKKNNNNNEMTCDILKFGLLRAVPIAKTIPTLLTVFDSAAASTSCECVFELFVE